jgi:hypothetical protein
MKYEQYQYPLNQNREKELHPIFLCCQYAKGLTIVRHRVNNVNLDNINTHQCPVLKMSTS